MIDFHQIVAERYNEQTEGKKSPVVAELYADTDFLNLGYWERDTKTVNAACENLVEELLKLIPNKAGNILDVACGKGATTRHLLKYFKPENVTGINISEKQVHYCREKVPNVRFEHMNATQMTFEDNLFDNIICVEAVHHFDTREKFLMEAYRVLRPGGMLVLADLRQRRTAHLHMPANFFKNLAEYRSIYARSPFKDCDIIDVSDQCLGGIVDHYYNLTSEKMRKGEVPRGRFFIVDKAYRLFRPTIRTSECYFLVACKKKGVSEPVSDT